MPTVFAMMLSLRFSFIVCESFIDSEYTVNVGYISINSKQLGCLVKNKSNTGI